MSTSKKAFKEATAFLRQFDNLLELADQVDEAGSLENFVARLKADAANLEATIAERLASADAEVAKRLADADNKAKAIVVAAEQAAQEKLAGINREIGAGERKLERIKSDIASTVAKYADAVA